MEKLRRIDRFGLEAITGRRVFYHREFRYLVTAENVFYAYQSRAGAQSWPEWVASHPYEARLLSDVEIKNA